MTDITDTELDLDAIEIGARAWSEHLANEARRGPIGTMFVSPWEVRALVAALRSATAERDALAEIIETNQETATMKLALDNTAAELERERTQNLRVREALEAIVEPFAISASRKYVVRSPRPVDLIELVLAARAALSTQQAPK